jgi:hypothetical protein
MRLDGAQRTITCPHCGKDIAIDEVIDRLVAAAEDENARLKAQLQGVGKDLVPYSAAPARAQPQSKATHGKTGS